MPRDDRWHNLCIEGSINTVRCVSIGMNMNKAFFPMILFGFLVYFGCLIHYYGEADEDSPDPATEAVSLNPVAIPAAEIFKIATKQGDAPHLRFMDYPCRNSCLDHVAGYRWAQENGVNDPDSCDGLSAEFIEGCRIYAEQRVLAVAMMN
jgi:hypothetical protein